MPGAMKTNGTDELVTMLSNLSNQSLNIAASALYEGAGVVADAYSKAVDQIRTAKRRHEEPGGRLPTPEEKESLRATGIARFSKDADGVDTMVGVAEGYTTVRGRKKAIKLLARSINSGTSFMKKQPVFRRASNTSRKAAQDAMVAKADELINQIVK